MPYCGILVLPNGTIKYDRNTLEIDLLKDLESAFSFKVNPVYGEQIWGDYINGSFNGAIGLIAEKVGHFFMKQLKTLSTLTERTYCNWYHLSDCSEK